MSFSSFTSFTSLPETVSTLSLAQLHLKPRSFKVLSERGVTAVGQLTSLIANNFQGVRNVSATAVTDVLRVITYLSRSIDPNGQVDWFKFWRSLNVIVLPTNHESETPPEHLSSLPALLKAILSFKDPTGKRWRTIERRFGLQGTRRMTLDEIGTAFNISRERIRQIEATAMAELREVLVENRYIGRGYHVHPDVLEMTKSLFEVIAANSQGFVLEGQLMHKAESVFGGNVSVKHYSTLFLLFHIFGLSHVETQQAMSIWEYGDTRQRKLLAKALNLLEELLTKTHTGPLDEFDILVLMNSRLSKVQKLDTLKLHKFLELCAAIERREDGLYQGRFEFLTRGAQAERVLTEAGKPLHVDDIAREINNRLASRGMKKIQVLNIANIMSADGRFVAVGSSGQRGLKSWTDLETGSILELMERCLISLNRPATEVEIANYVAKRRPVSKQSIKMYLASKEIFKKADRQRWGLASWAETQDALTWSMEQVAEFVANLFKERNARELEFRIVRKALAYAASVNTHQAMGMLKVNPVIISRREQRPFKICAVFQTDYKKKLAAYKSPISRKTKTKLGLAETVVRDMLQSESSNQIELAKLVEELVSKHSFLNKTAYQYISRMDFIEKIDLPESGVRICRLKGKKTASFPQLEKLRMLDSTKGDEASKAVAKLTLTEVDNGLFLLGRLFEGTLRDFMITVEKTKKYPVGPGNYAKLNNMIQWIESKGIVSEKTILNFLRLERNERAHAAAPTLEEREMMLKSAPWMASIYLNYIVYFKEHTTKLRAASA
ncbi:MAG: hypothetical protein QOF62_235 [Pyrinomonadaceae bacterium]|jgi:hypothetical protein|nr:hypothetical protein [Pyrinomonadaceae bacterium]